MKCPDQGKILLYLEDQLDPEENRLMESHLASCSQCLQLLNEVEDSMMLILHSRDELMKQFYQFEPAGHSQVWSQVQKQRNKNRWRTTAMKFKKAAVAAVIVLAIGFLGTAPAVQTVAANFLQVFRVQNVETVTLGPNDMMQIENALRQGDTQFDIDNFGRVEAIGTAEDCVLQAEELSNLSFGARFPDQLTEQEAEYTLQKTPTIEFQPRVTNVNKFLAALGSEYKLPEALDEKTCRIIMEPSLITRYDDLMLVQTPAPRIEVPEGVKVEEAARAMVALPIWPDNVRTQLEAVSDWEHTLVIPTGENSSKVMVNGSNAVLINENNFKSLVWQENGILYILEDYSDSQMDLVEIARSMR